MTTPPIFKLLESILQKIGKAFNFLNDMKYISQLSFTSNKIFSSHQGHFLAHHHIPPTNITTFVTTVNIFKVSLGFYDNWQYSLLQMKV